LHSASERARCRRWERSHRRSVRGGCGIEEKKFSPPQIAARPVSKQRSRLFKHFILCKLIVAVCYSFFVATRGRLHDPEFDDNPLAFGKNAARMMGVRAEWPLLA